MTQPDPAQLTRALDNFAAAFTAEDTICDTAQSLACGEIDAIVGLLDVLDRTEAAELWRSEHARSDDADDPTPHPERGLLGWTEPDGQAG